MSFYQFKSQMQFKVGNIASAMNLIYSNKCNSQTSLCKTMSYNECQGTDQKQCMPQLNKGQQCAFAGAAVSKSSGTRLPHSILPSSLTNQQRLFICASTKLDETFYSIKKQYGDKVKRIYFGSSFGFFRVYPGEQRQNENGRCKVDYDPRFRPWYVSATSGSKNVIIVIDVSNSMEGNTLNLAKSAAKSVINTLGLYDFVGVVSFSTNATIISFSSLQRATKNVKQNFYAKIDGLYAIGNTNYEQAFKNVETLLKSSTADQLGSPCPNSSNIVLFLTDGIPTLGAMTSSQLITQINQWNRNYNISMFTYGLGTNYNYEILKQLSCAYRGITFLISSSSSNSQLLSQMKNYYIYISEGVQINKAVWSQPYTDAFTEQRMVTISMPVYYYYNSIRVILGVAGIDVTMKTLQSYQIPNQNQAVKVLMIDSPCLISNLSECQLEQLRLQNVKCGVQNCQASPSPASLQCSFQTPLNVFGVPPLKGKPNRQCCGLTIAGLVGVIIGCVLFVILLGIAIYFIKKKQLHMKLCQKISNKRYRDPQIPPVGPNSSQIPRNPYSKDTSGQQVSQNNIISIGTQLQHNVKVAQNQMILNKNKMVKEDILI